MNDITRRDYFAGLAMQALLNRKDLGLFGEEGDLTEHAFIVAREMELKALALDADDAEFRARIAKAGADALKGGA